MNTAQRIILAAGFLLILIMALFPPWTYTYDPPQRTRRYSVAGKTEHPAGYHFLFGEHALTEEQDHATLLRLFNLGWDASLESFSIRVDTGRLTIQIVVATILITILCFALKSRH